MPGDEADIAWRLIEDKRAVDQNIIPQESFNRVYEPLMRHQTIGPVEKEMKAIESFERGFAAASRNRFERVPKKRYLVV